MAAECYVCLGSSAAYNSVSVIGAKGQPLGGCGICSIFACGYHALRNTFPKRWECIICVVSNIAPFPDKDDTGGDASDPLAGLGIIEGSEVTYAGVQPELIQHIRALTEDADATLLAYYRERRTAGTHFLSGEEPELDELIPRMMRGYGRTRLAAAIAVIEYCGLSQEVLAPYLRRDPDSMGGLRMGAF